VEREIKIEGVEDPCKELSAESSSGDEILKSIFEFLREKGVGYSLIVAQGRDSKKPLDLSELTQKDF